MNVFTRITASLFIILSVVSCSTTDLIKAGAGALGVTSQEPMLSIDTEVGDDTAVIGDTSALETSFHEVEGDVLVNNSNQKTNKNVEKAEQVTFNESMSPFALMLIAFLAVFGAIGWMLPSWSQMRKQAKG